MSRGNRTPDGAPRTPNAQPTADLPPEPADVDALLAESLRAQSEQDFTWREPERSPRWWERAEAQAPPIGSPLASQSGAPSSAARPHRGRNRVRIGSAVFALAALLLAAWVIASVVFGVTVEPVVIGLIICTLAGLALVAAGLRPKPGARL